MTVNDSSRQPGRGRYSHAEREQRWLLASVPAGVSSPRTIVDRYITGTTLRVRAVDDGVERLYKWTQKVRDDVDDPTTIHITNMYLTKDEYAIVSSLAADVLTKTRWHLSFGELKYAVDEFTGPHEGLVLAERELGSDPFGDAPFDVVRDVTRDDRYSGGRLAVCSRDQVAELLGRR